MDELHSFFNLLGFPLGLQSKKIKNFLRFTAPLDIHIYERKFIFFYDVLTEIAKNRVLQKTVELDCEEKWGDDVYFETKKCIEKKTLEYSIMARE